ncbi:MAG TPA: hypothetical protein VGG92_22735 [Caulobacteraceae bacterium]|jgi:GR25 family glycosyltransferase involved in LPS biosynthesis
MRFHYINLNSAHARRAALESNAALVAPAADLIRFSAVTAEAGAAADGKISTPEKACFLSHRNLLASRDAGETIFVLEDDVQLSRLTFPVVTAAASAGGEDWDLLFTDVAVPDRNVMLDLIRRRRPFAGRFTTLDLAAMPFAGASAYAVHARARTRLSELLAAEASLDTPYDLVLRRLVYTGALKARCVFPFVTTLADSAFESQVQGDAKTLKDLPLNLFRRLMSADRDLSACLVAAERLDQLMCDDEARVAGAVFAGMASRAYDPIAS